MVQHGHGMVRLGWHTTAQRPDTPVSLATRDTLARRERQLTSLAP